MYALNVKEMKKKSPRIKAKDKAWNVFSKYIRRKYADKDGYIKCVTCGATKYWEKDGMQAGHFISSRCNSVLFDERLVYPQCLSCNIHKSGNKVAFTLFMLKTYTVDEIAEFEALKHKSKKMSISDYKDIEDKYTDLLIGQDIREVY